MDAIIIFFVFIVVSMARAVFGGTDRVRPS